MTTETKHVIGVITEVLSEDRKGSRHQKFVIITENGNSLLIVHNIDIAPRILGLKAGEPVEVQGQFTWNRHGGVIHWTHHDPRDNHHTGFIKYHGRLYQ